MATGSQTGGAASGAASGAAAGFAVGGVYGAVAGAVIGGISGFLSGDDGSAAKRAKEQAERNAKAAVSSGYANAVAQLKMSALSSEMSLGSTAMNLQISGGVDVYNASLQDFLGEYNAGLLEEEAATTWRAADLSIEQMQQEHDRANGIMRTQYGASGVLLDQDSALIADIDARTQQEMDVMIVRYNADQQAKKFLDAAAKSRWDGDMAAETIMFEGKMNRLAAVSNVTLATSGAYFQTKMNADMTYYNATLQGNQIYEGGNQAYANWEASDNQALVSGLFSAASTAASSYAQYKTPTSSATSFSGAGSSNPDVKTFTGYKTPTVGGGNTASNGFNNYLNQKYGNQLI